MNILPSIGAFLVFKDGETVFASVPKAESGFLTQIPAGTRYVDFGEFYYFPAEIVSAAACPEDQRLLRGMVEQVIAREGRN